jgi:uncharacterized NAD(P)/FAD-binding protein YdhS
VAFAVPRYDVAIIGAGFSGASVAMQLARRAGSTRRVLLLDRENFGPGTAYAAPSQNHLMNGTARSMSAFEHDEQHLVRWLGDEPGHALISRARFGRYISDTLDDAMRRYPTLSRERAQIVDVVPGGLPRLF